MSEQRVTLVIDNSLNPCELRIKEIWHNNDKFWKNGNVLDDDIYDRWKHRKFPTSISAGEKARFVLTDNDRAGLVYETENLLQNNRIIEMKFGFTNPINTASNAEGSELTGLRSYYCHGDNFEIYYQPFSQSSAWWEDGYWYPANRYGYTDSNKLQQKSIHRYPNWMKDHFDHLKHKTLTEICIPGSHDSATAIPFEPFHMMPWAICQTLSIKKQLEYGIRSFDFRVKYQEKNGISDFYIYHGMADSGTKIEPMLKDMADFLKTHPKEFVFVLFNSMANDGTTEPTVYNEWDEPVNQKFDNILKEYFNPYFVMPDKVDLYEQPFEDYIKSDNRVFLYMYIQKKKLSKLKKEKLYSYAWRKGEIADVAFPMSTNINKLRKKELSSVQFGEFRKPKIQTKPFLIKEMILTPFEPSPEPVINLAGGIYGATTFDEQLIRNEMSQSNIGIIHADFVENGDFIQTCIRQNKIQIPEEKEVITFLSVNGHKGWRTKLPVNGCFFKGKYYLSFVGTDKKIRILSSTDGVDYKNHSLTINKSEWKTNNPVGLHVWKNKLYLSVVGDGSGKVWLISSSDGVNFTPYRVLESQEWKTNHEIGIASTSDKLYLTTGTDDGKIWLLSTKDGKTFKKQSVPDWQSFYPVGITTWKDKVYLTAIGKDSHLIWILSTEDGERFISRHLLDDIQWRTYHKAGLSARSNGLYITAVDENGEVWLMKYNIAENTVLKNKLLPEFIETVHSVGIYKSKNTSDSIIQVEILNGDGKLWLLESNDGATWKPKVLI